MSYFRNLLFDIRHLLILSLILFPVLLSAQDAPPAEKSGVEPPPNEPIEVTRADLARAYLRFEHAFQANPPTDEARLAEVSTQFDQATLDFFAGKQADTIKKINELAASLHPTQPRPRIETIGAAIKVIRQERIWPYVNFTMALYPRVVSLYPVTLHDAGELELRLRALDESGQVPVFMDQPFKIAVGPEVSIDALVNGMFEDEILPGRYDMEIFDPTSEESFPLAPWYVIPRAFNEIRAENLARIEKIQTTDLALVEALATVKARNGLLSSDDMETNSSKFLMDPNKIINEVEKEIVALESGKNPYHRRVGDYWRVLNVSPRPIPMRWYAPKAVTKDTPLPIVIALHGAGGDENMFMDGYGAGQIKKLADKHGFIVVSPATSQFGGSATGFDALIEALGQCYAIDPSRVYVLGHSMGAGATAKLAVKYSAQIKAACCLAGGNFNPTQTTMAPTLVMAAELDLVIPLAKLQPGIDAIMAAGAPVELRIIKNLGHTVVVTAKLGEAVEWLMAK